MTLESFTMGRDSGIDFRYRSGGVHLIVQCKHYAESGHDTLARVLAGKERRKLEALKPTRYILATSVGLTPARKEVLLKILAPYCLDGRLLAVETGTLTGTVQCRLVDGWLTDASRGGIIKFDANLMRTHAGHCQRHSVA